MDTNRPGETPDPVLRGEVSRSLRWPILDGPDAEHRFQAIITASADPVMMIGPDYKVIYASPEAERLLSEGGTTPDDMFAAVHPEDVRQVQDSFLNVASGPVGTRRQVDMRVRQRDGWRWIAAWIINQIGVPGVDALVTYGRDVTAQYEAEEALRSRAAVDEMIKRISLRLVDVGADEIDHAVLEALGELAQLCSADRAWIFRIDPTRRLIDNTHEWCGPGVSSEIDQLKGLPLENLPGFYSWLGDAEPLVVRSLSALGPELAEERTILEGQNIKSMVAQSIFVRGELFGMVGCDSVHAEVPWSAPTIWALDACATVFGAALRRCDAEAALADNEARFRAMYELASDGVWILDAARHVIYSSPAVERITGHADENLADGGMRLLLVHPDDRRALVAHRRASLANPGSTLVCTYRMQRPDGTWVYLDDTATNLLHDPAVRGIVVNLRDVTDRHRQEAELVEQARRDLLTGFPNRLLFEELLDAAAARSELTGSRLAVIAVDLDRFRLVNESLGHPVGDAVLVSAAERLGQVVRGGDVLARRGADEFVILCEPINDDELASLTAAIVDEFRVPFAVGGRSAYTTASVGSSISGPGTADPATLVREADAALASAKGNGGDRAVRFSGVLVDTARARLDLEAQLRYGLRTGAFRLLYQPMVDVASGQVVGAEALLRWDHHERGLLAPDAFLEVCEDTGLIVPVGEWVLAEALEQLATWQQTLHPDLLMHVNVSARQLRPGGLAEFVVGLVERTGVNPRSVCVEVTESALLAGASAVRELAAMRSAGVHVALDDFGTGHSSLAHLRNFDIDILKIDRDFVAGMATPGADLAIVSAIINLARSLSLQVVGEGVESEAQALRLASMGCDQVQGYWYARPLAVEAFEAYVSERGAKPAVPPVRPVESNSAAQ